jgi:phosphate transport system substrate-binding protein
MTDRGRARRALTAALGMLLLGGPAASASGRAPATRVAPAASGRPPASYAVITHPETPVSGVSLAQLRRVFLGEQQFWPGGLRVVLFVGAPRTPARAVALRHLYEMSEAEFKRYWIGKTFRDDVTAGPKLVASSAMARRLTAALPGAVALVPTSEVDASVRVLAVDGKLPGADGYRIVEPGDAP